MNMQRRKKKGVKVCLHGAKCKAGSNCRFFHPEAETSWATEKGTNGAEVVTTALQALGIKTDSIEPSVLDCLRQTALNLGTELDIAADFLQNMIPGTSFEMAKVAVANARALRAATTTDLGVGAGPVQLLPHQGGVWDGAGALRATAAAAAAGSAPYCSNPAGAAFLSSPKSQQHGSNRGKTTAAKFERQEESALSDGPRQMLGKTTAMAVEDFWSGGTSKSPLQHSGGGPRKNKQSKNPELQRLVLLFPDIREDLVEFVYVRKFKYNSHLAENYLTKNQSLEGQEKIQRRKAAFEEKGRILGSSLSTKHNAPSCESGSGMQQDHALPSQQKSSSSGADWGGQHGTAITSEKQGKPSEEAAAFQRSKGAAADQRRLGPPPGLLGSKAAPPPPSAAAARGGPPAASPVVALSAATPSAPAAFPGLHTAQPEAGSVGGSNQQKAREGQRRVNPQLLMLQAAFTDIDSDLVEYIYARKFKYNQYLAEEYLSKNRSPQGQRKMRQKKEVADRKHDKVCSSTDAQHRDQPASSLRHHPGNLKTAADASALLKGGTAAGSPPTESGEVSPLPPAPRRTPKPISSSVEPQPTEADGAPHREQTMISSRGKAQPATKHGGGGGGSPAALLTPEVFLRLARGHGGAPLLCDEVTVDYLLGTALDGRLEAGAKVDVFEAVLTGMRRDQAETMIQKILSLATQNSDGDSNENGAIEISSQANGDPASCSEEDDLAFLQALVPGVDRALARYLLRGPGGGCRAAAADHLLAHTLGGPPPPPPPPAAAAAAAAAAVEGGLAGLRRRQEEWERKRAENAQFSSESSLKSTLLARFDEKEETIGKKHSPYVQVSKAKSKQIQQNGTAKVRWRNGKVVTHKGEKLVVEDEKPEWDGGSRGKVMTKGKRGKGYR